MSFFAFAETNPGGTRNLQFPRKNSVAYCGDMWDCMMGRAVSFCLKVPVLLTGLRKYVYTVIVICGYFCYHIFIGYNIQWRLGLWLATDMRKKKNTANLWI